MHQCVYVNVNGNIR